MGSRQRNGADRRIRFVRRDGGWRACRGSGKRGSEEPVLPAHSGWSAIPDGLALLNASASDANVDVYAVTPDGSLIGKTSVTVSAGQKVTKVIHELIPETLGVNGGFVFVRSSNNVPLYGIELFYTQDLKVMSNVAAGKLVPGVLYVAPE